MGGATTSEGEGLANRVHLTRAGGISLVVLIIQCAKINMDSLTCKLCDSDCTASKQRKTVVSVHAHMFDMASDVCPDAPRDAIHQFLAANPVYLCRTCHTAVQKYAMIAPSVRMLQEKIRNQSGLKASFSMNYYDVYILIAHALCILYIFCT